MGQDKADLRVHGLRMIEHVLRALDPLCEEVWLGTGTRPRYLELGRLCVLDSPSAGGSKPSSAPGGPLQGIAAGLRLARTRSRQAWLVVAACDMPRLLPATYSRLLASCAEGVDFVGLRSSRGPEPLCSVWSVRLLAAVEQTLAAGEARPMDALSRSQGARWLELSETEAAQTMNINTPEDLRRIQRPRA